MEKCSIKNLYRINPINQLMQGSQEVSHIQACQNFIFMFFHYLIFPHIHIHTLCEAAKKNQFNAVGNYYQRKRERERERGRRKNT
jgi:hypothetical protein